MKAIILRFENRVDNIVKDLLDGFDYSNFEFDVSHWESYGDDIKGSEYDFNCMEKIPSELIKRKILMENNRVNPEFMELFIRKIGTMSKQIFYYKDFLDSDYIMSIINFDHRNIEICAKDEALLKKIKDNFSKLDLENKNVKELDNIPLDAVLQSWRSDVMKGIED